MEKNRIAGWACGLIAAILVIMAGKSCTQSMKDSKKTADNKTTAASSDITIHIEYPEKDESNSIQLDMFGRPIVPEISSETETAAETETATDEFGNVIEIPTADETKPQIEYVTDFFGNITTAVQVTSEDETEGEEDTEKPTLSPLEQYNEDQKKPPPGISGYNHGQFDKDGNPVATIPPDFVIIID